WRAGLEASRSPTRIDGSQRYLARWSARTAAASKPWHISRRCAALLLEFHVRVGGNLHKAPANLRLVRCPSQIHTLGGGRADSSCDRPPRTFDRHVPVRPCVLSAIDRIAGTWRRRVFDQILQPSVAPN